MRTAVLQIGAYGGFHQELEGLKRDKNLLMMELVRLRQAQAVSGQAGGQRGTCTEQAYVTHSGSCGACRDARVDRAVILIMQTTGNNSPCPSYPVASRSACCARPAPLSDVLHLPPACPPFLPCAVLRLQAA